MRSTSGTLPTDYTFTGQKVDASAGLMYYGARYYDAQIGRFIQADTIVPSLYNPQSLNRYAYVRNNPVRYTDPTGHCEPDECPGRYRRDSSGAAWWDVSKPEPPEETGRVYSPSESVREAWGLVSDWFFNRGSSVRIFGPDSSLTQDVMYDEGMRQFREAWAKEGYPLPWSWEHRADDRNKGWLPERVARGAGVYVREHMVELGLSTVGLGSSTPEGPIDPVGGTIGSLDRVFVSDAGNGMVYITVYNSMDWHSRTRIPGTDISILQPVERNGWLPGGTLEMYFIWTERVSSSSFH